MGASCMSRSTSSDPSPTPPSSTSVIESDTCNKPQEFSSDHVSTSLPSNNCNLDVCNALIRIQYILSHEQQDTLRHSPHHFINTNLCQYNNIHLIDDFHHLMFVHQHQFEEIYTKLPPCHHDLDKCTSFTRNHRDRSRTNSRNIYNNYRNTLNTIKDINTIQILDQIHCYFHHTFDMIYKLKKDDQNKLNAQIEAMKLQQQQNDSDLHVESDDNDDSYNDSSKMVRAMSDRMNEIKKINTDRSIETLRNASRSRFNIINTKNRPKYCQLERNLSISYEAVDDDIKSAISHDIVYSFGVRFVYDCDQKHEEWYIAAKYKSLKHELIENIYKDFGIEQWDILYEKAMQFSKSKRIQKECIFIDTGDVVVKRSRKRGFHAIANEPMSIDHLIAIMIYCNFDVLQAQFSASYRRELNESNDELKRKHSEWHQMGLYLRQVVEIYGTKISSQERKLRKKLKFFHGINTEMVFVSTSSKIYGPLSTSSEALVALTFAGDDGLLLELSGNNARFFDCCGVSDFSNENEKLFIGGYDPLLIETVINPRTIDYRPYIKAINIISCLFSGHEYYGRSRKAFGNKTKKLVFCLLYDRYNKMDQDNNGLKDIEPYIEKLFNHYRTNVSEIVIDWRLMNMDHDDLVHSIKGFMFIKNAICMKTFDWIKMNRVVGLFEYLQVIRLKYIHLSTQVMDYILHVLETRGNDEIYENLKRIVIYQPLQDKGVMIDDILEIYGDRFRQKVKWTMAVECTHDYLDLVIQKL